MVMVNQEKRAINHWRCGKGSTPQRQTATVCSFLGWLRIMGSRHLKAILDIARWQAIGDHFGLLKKEPLPSVELTLIKDVQSGEGETDHKGAFCSQKSALHPRAERTKSSQSWKVQNSPRTCPESQGWGSAVTKWFLGQSSLSPPHSGSSILNLIAYKILAGYYF